jgi:hypothetical protein
MLKLSSIYLLSLFYPFIRALRKSSVSVTMPGVSEMSPFETKCRSVCCVGVLEYAFFLPLFPYFLRGIIFTDDKLIQVNFSFHYFGCGQVSFVICKGIDKSAQDVE